MVNETKQIFGASKNILRVADHFVAVPVKISSSILSADSDGRKILTAGTVVTKAGALMQAADANAADAFGVVYEDLDLTNGNDSASVVIHGVIDEASLPTAVTTAQKTAMKGLLFV